MRHSFLGSVFAVLLAAGLPRGGAHTQDGNLEKVLLACKPAGQQTSNIFSMNPDGTARTNLTNSKDLEVDPVWSPARNRIAFVVLDPVRRSGDIYVVNADGAQRTQLTRHGAKTGAFAPSWSPDGKQIIFSALHDGDLAKTYVHVMDADGGNLRRLGEGTGLFPVWSPDGNKILYTVLEKGGKGPLDNPRLYLMDADGKNAKPLTEGKSQTGAYSPDGKRIAYVGDVAGQISLAVMNSDGSQPKALLKTGSGEWGPRWSADGTRIFFNRSEVGLRTVILVMDADGRNVKQLTADRDWSVLSGNAFFAVAGK